MSSAVTKEILVVPFFAGGNQPGSSDRKDLEAAVATIPEIIGSNINAVIAPQDGQGQLESLREVFGVSLHVPTIKVRGYPVTAETFETALRRRPERNRIILVLVPVSTVVDILAATANKDRFCGRIMPMTYVGAWSDYSIDRSAMSPKKQIKAATARPDNNAALQLLLAGTSLSPSARRLQYV